jgi:Transposase
VRRCVHLLELVADALDDVRRQLWKELRRLPDDRYAKAFKGSRWCLWKNPEDLTDRQAAHLARIRRTRGGIWRAYEMKEQFRAVFAGDLQPADAIEALDRLCARAQRSRLPAFVKVARTMRERRGLIVNALGHRISNGRVEGLNTKVRLLVRRAYGFHSTAALALVMLACGPITSPCPTNTQPFRPPRDPHRRQESIFRPGAHALLLPSGQHYRRIERDIARSGATSSIWDCMRTRVRTTLPRRAAPVNLTGGSAGALPRRSTWAEAVRPDRCRVGDYACALWPVIARSLPSELFAAWLSRRVGLRRCGRAGSPLARTPRSRDRGPKRVVIVGGPLGGRSACRRGACRQAVSRGRDRPERPWNVFHPPDGRRMHDVAQSRR